MFYYVIFGTLKEKFILCRLKYISFYIVQFLFLLKTNNVKQNKLNYNINYSY